MRLQTRLGRLERKAPPLTGASESDEASDPPCPVGINPADWSFRLRVARCGEARLNGLLRPDEYLPDMDEGERRYVDDLAKVFAELDTLPRSNSVKPISWSDENGPADA